MKNTLGIYGVMLGCALSVCADQAGAQDWPQWRGPHRDNKLVGFHAPKTWPKKLTKKWSVTVGIGEASPVLMDGKIYTFSRQGGNEVTLCLDAETGNELWKDEYAAVTVTGPARGYPGPRSTPAVGAGKVCTLGVGGVVSCLDAATGKVVWRKDTKSKPQYYTSTSPMIADGKCIVFTKGLTAYDLANGDVKWEWTGADAPYGSPVLMTVDGAKQVVTPSMGYLAGVSMNDGKLLWKVKIGSNYQNNYSTPVIDGQTVIYSIGARRRGGSMMAVRIEKKDDGYTATEVWRKDFAAAGYHTPVRDNGLLYGVSQEGRHFFCLDAKTGKEKWMDKSTSRGQCGSILNAGSLLVALTSDKDLVVFQASDREYTEVAKYRVSDSETWAVPIVTGNRIFVKDKAGSLTLWTID